MNAQGAGRFHGFTRAEPTVEGAGVILKRTCGFARIPDFELFLLLDDFRSDTPPSTSRVSLGLRTGAS